MGLRPTAQEKIVNTLIKLKSLVILRLDAFDYDLRHFYATNLYHKSKDILLVKQQLGHKKIETTLLYTQLVNLGEEDDFYSATAKTVEEAAKLIEQGFDYICDVDGVKLFRKRK